TRPEYQAGGLYGLNCPAVGGCTKSQAFPVPDALRDLLLSRGPDQLTSPTVPMPVYDETTGLPIPQLGANSNWSLGGTTYYMPGRELRNVSQLYQLVAGLEGDLGVGDWTWEAYVSHGETQIDNNYLNYASLRRYQEIIQSPNYGRNWSTEAAGSTSASCTSGLPVFEQFEVSQDCIDAITIDITDRTQLTQTVVEENLQGGLFDLPAGEIRSAFGLSYRKNDFLYKPDATRETNSTIDIPIGTFA